MERGGRKPNGTNGSRDIYTQLINNDMVKELDDIEAISQQISQHAEVLYNSWKNNGVSQNPVQYKLSSAQSVSPSLDETSNPLSRDLRERGGTSSPRLENGGVPNRNQAPFNSIPAGYRNGGDTGVSNKFPSESYGSLDRQYSSVRPQPSFSTNSLDRHGSYPERNPPFNRNSNSSSPRNSTVSSPTSSTRESPSKGSSITHISPSSNTDVGPLELLASPNLTGNLEELVTSFVSTDRAKQAARNTISSTIMRRLGSPNGSASPVRSPSPTSTLTYRGASPLRSPMLTNSIRSVGSPDPLSPKPSSSSMFPSDILSPMSVTGSNINDFIHAPMQSIFSKDNGRMSPSIQSPMTQSPSHKSPMIQSPGIRSPGVQSPGFKSPLSPLQAQKSSHVQSPNLKPSLDQPDSIPIPVKVISSPSSSQGLKSPSVLQSVHKNPFQFPLEKPVIEHEPMPNLFDQFGTVRDQDENIMAMRRRFEEAKQRMALSLPAREGGLRPNSLIARSMFDSDKFSPWGDDASSFLLEQLRRKNKRRMETPAAPHPELTPQQKQHIFERSSTPSTLQPGAPMRRMLPGGSVAERVLMFEKSPSLFGLDPGQGTRVLPIRREPMLTGTALTPWRSQTHENQNKQVGFTFVYK